MSHRGAGHRLGKGLSFASCGAILGSLQGTDCAGRALACLRSNTRDDCCCRRRGSGDGAIVFQWLAPGLRPRHHANAAFVAYWNPGLAPGDDLSIIHSSRRVVVSGRGAKPRMAQAPSGLRLRRPRQMSPPGHNQGDSPLPVRLSLPWVNHSRSNRAKVIFS